MDTANLPTITQLVSYLTEESRGWDDETRRIWISEDGNLFHTDPSIENPPGAHCLGDTELGDFWAQDRGNLRASGLGQPPEMEAERLQKQLAERLAHSRTRTP